MYKMVKNEESADTKRFIPYLFQEFNAQKPSKSQGEQSPDKEFKPVDLSGHCVIAPDSESEKELVENEKSLEDIEKNAYTDGFMKGKTEGFVKGEKAGAASERQKLQVVFETVEKAAEELGKRRKELYLDAERAAVELALAIAARVVSHEVSANQETIVGVLKRALEKVIDQEKIKIRINTLDLQLVNESGFGVSNVNDQVREVIMEGDNTISRGGCIIETGFGSIDARIESQLQAVEDLLKAEMP